MSASFLMSIPVMGHGLAKLHAIVLSQADNLGFYCDSNARLIQSSRAQKMSKESELYLAF